MNLLQWVLFLMMVLVLLLVMAHPKLMTAFILTATFSQLDPQIS